MKGIFSFRSPALALLLLGLLTNTASAETTFITDKVSVELFSSTFQRGVLVTTVNSGTVVEVIETDGDFSKIRTPDNQEGWLHRKYLSTEKPTQVSYLQLMAKHKQLEEELEQLKSQSQNTAEAEKEKAIIHKIRGDLDQAKKTISGLQSQLKQKTTALEQSQQQLAALEKQHQDSLKELQTAKAETPATAAPETAQETPIAQPPAAVEAPAMRSPTQQPPAFDLDYPIALKWLLVSALLSILIGGYLGYQWLDNKIRRRHGGVRIR